MIKLLAVILAGVGLVSHTVSAAGCGAVAGGTCASTAAPAAKVAAPATINPAGLAALLQSGAKVVVLDARSGKFDDGRRLPGAKSLTDQATAEQAAAVIPSRDTLVVTYCANPKCQASPKLAKHLQGLGYTNVVELPEGIDGWVGEGRAVEKAN